ELLASGRFNPQIPAPVRQVFSFTGSSSASVAFQQSLQRASLTPGPQLSITTGRNHLAPLTQTATVDISKTFADHLTIGTSAVYSHTTRMLTVTDVNLGSPLGTGPTADFGYRFVNPNFAQAFFFGGYGR